MLISKTSLKRSLHHLGLSLCLLTTGCVQLVHHKYDDLTVALEEEVILHVDTYPSGFGSDGLHLPYLYLRAHTQKAVYLRVSLNSYIDNGSNSEAVIQSASIKALSYQLAHDKRIQLISEQKPYIGRYWAQPHKPIPFIEGQVLTVAVKFEFNGKDYLHEGSMQAVSEAGLPYPLFLNTMGN